MSEETFNVIERFEGEDVVLFRCERLESALHNMAAHGEMYPDRGASLLVRSTHRGALFEWDPAEKVARPAAIEDGRDGPATRGASPFQTHVCAELVSMRRLYEISERELTRALAVVDADRDGSFRTGNVMSVSDGADLAVGLARCQR